MVKQLAEYIEKNSPDTKGFSDKNLWRMKQFYETYSGENEKLSLLVRQLSWTNNLIILSRTKTIEEKIYYLKQRAQHGKEAKKPLPAIRRRNNRKYDRHCPSE